MDVAITGEHLMSKQLDWTLPRFIKGNGYVDRINIRNSGEGRCPWIITVFDKHGRRRDTEAYECYNDARASAYEWLEFGKIL